jgi:hypothetical protein
MARQRRFIFCAITIIVGIWLLAVTGHWYLESLKMTSEKVRAYMASVDFAHLTGAARVKALKDLEDKVNALSYEERQRLRMQHLIDEWFREMTEKEKEEFVAATLPTGFKQMINAFEQLPPDKRQKLIDNTMNNLRDAKDHPAGGMQGANGSPISPELEAKVRSIGLNTFYSQSSAETKAEMAPVLEELQHQMESGRIIMRQ